MIIQITSPHHSGQSSATLQQSNVDHPQSSHVISTTPESVTTEHPYSLELAVEGDPSILEILLQSLEPEITIADRTAVALFIRDGSLVLRISALDLTALRAAMNSHFRWLNEAREVVEKSGEITSGTR
jgi:tRNA threonylcarbamoyladenosine modification (KEOPS) complex  Pcc1 subunit